MSHVLHVSILNMTGKPWDRRRFANKSQETEALLSRWLACSCCCILQVAGCMSNCTQVAHQSGPCPRTKRHMAVTSSAPSLALSQSQSPWGIWKHADSCTDMRAQLVARIHVHTQAPSLHLSSVGPGFHLTDLLCLLGCGHHYSKSSSCKQIGSVKQ